MDIEEGLRPSDLARARQNKLAGDTALLVVFVASSQDSGSYGDEVGAAERRGKAVP